MSRLTAYIKVDVHLCRKVLLHIVIVRRAILPLPELEFDYQNCSKVPFSPVMIGIYRLPQGGDGNFSGRKPLHGLPIHQTA